jgi:hypothetical protein
MERYLLQRVEMEQSDSGYVMDNNVIGRVRFGSRLPPLPSEPDLTVSDYPAQTLLQASQLRFRVRPLMARYVQMLEVFDVVRSAFSAWNYMMGFDFLTVE